MLVSFCFFLRHNNLQNVLKVGKLKFVDETLPHFLSTYNVWLVSDCIRFS